jgi:uncharacterized protein (UPF0276 family)
MKALQTKLPELGFGLGLRPQHYQHILANRPKVDWFEIISENYMDTDGPAKRRLERIRESYPIVMHGVSMSIGTVDPINSAYLSKLKALAKWVEPAWISDHLCWTGVAHKNTHDLLPVPYTEEALSHIVRRIKQVQDFLERPLTLENPSTYLEFVNSTISEPEFISQMVKESGCHLLLDVNNIYVSCFNHHADPKEYIDSMPLDQVIQVHLAGHQNNGTHIIDTHDDYVVDEVWALYKYTVNRAKRVPNTMIEWDDKIPEFDVLDAELTKARRAAANAESYGPLPTIEVITHANISKGNLALDRTQGLVQTSIMNRSDYSTEWIRENGGLSPDARLGIYRHAYRQRLLEVLAGDFPALKNYLGDESFGAMATQFIESTPPNHFNIGKYSINFGEYLFTNCRDSFTVELCQLESTIAELLDARETPALKPDAASLLNSETIAAAILIPRDAARLLAHRNNPNRYYQDYMDGVTEGIQVNSAPSWLAVLRNDDVIWRIELGEAEHLILSQLFSGVSIGTAIEKAESSINYQITESQIQDWFNRWMSAELFTEVRI